MTWTKLSDDFPFDCWTLSDAAFRLHIEGLCWSNRMLLDGVIPKDDMHRFAKEPDTIEELVSGGWWSTNGESYVIKHHMMYQPTREKVIAQQARSRENGARGGRPKKKPKQVSQQATYRGTQQKTRQVNQAESTTSELAENPQVKTQQVSQMETQRDGTGIEKGIPTYRSNFLDNGEPDFTAEDAEKVGAFFSEAERKYG